MCASFAEVGSLMGYGSNFAATNILAGTPADKSLHPLKSGLPDELAIRRPYRKALL
jgi:hypothetical protein